MAWAARALAWLSINVGIWGGEGGGEEKTNPTCFHARCEQIGAKGCVRVVGGDGKESVSCGFSGSLRGDP